MRILLSDPFEESGLSKLKSMGFTLAYHPENKTEEQLAKLLREFKPDILIVRSTRITADLIQETPLKLIIRAGAGVNTIDVPACSRKGVFVSNCPGKNSVAVAELAFGLILSLDRRIVENSVSLKEGKWNKKEYSRSKGIHGRTLGLIGLGNIGQEMIPRSKAFGLKVRGWSQHFTPEKADELNIGFSSSLIDLAQNSDIVSIHIPLKEETRSLIGREFLQAMKKNAMLINTSRAEIIDEKALTQALDEKRIQFASDVFHHEPSTTTGTFSDSVGLKPDVHGTHHIGASTDQAQNAIAMETVKIVETFKTSGKVLHAVNLASRSPAKYTLTVRHRDQPGVLAGVLTAVRFEGINVQEMENIVFEGAEAAVAHINLDEAPSAETLERLKRSNDHILDLDLFKL